MGKRLTIVNDRTTTHADPPSTLSEPGLKTTSKESSFLSIPNCLRSSVRSKKLARGTRRCQAQALRFTDYSSPSRKLQSRAESLRRQAPELW